MSRLHRPAIVRVAVITPADDVWKLVEGWLADEVTIVERFASVLELCDAVEPHVLVLDRPAFRELERDMCRLRSRWPAIEVIVIRVRDSSDVAHVLDIGADAAVTSDLTVMAARLRALVRRARTIGAGCYTSVGDMVYDREARRLWCAGREIALTPTEQALLDCLFRYAPHPVGIETLAEQVWGDSSSRNRLALARVYVGYLRRKLRTSQRVSINTVRGSGYKLTSR